MWDGGFFAIGRSEGVVPPHAHHALQIVIGIGKDIAIRGEHGDWQLSRGVVVRPDVTHSFDGSGAIGAMLFVEPESMEGLWLRSSLDRDITTVAQARVEKAAGELRTFLERPFESVEIGALIRNCVQAFCSGAPPARRLDPRVTAVLKTIQASDDLRLSLETAAATVFLSPGRFAHLFKQQVGLPFRRYMLWRKLARAVLAIAQEGTMAAAAQAADFSDAAHLTRTFYQMFGLPPSVMMRGEFFQIKPPFGVD